MKNRLTAVLESFVILMILLVIVQTFLEDFAVVAGMSVDARRILAIAGFGFDLFFTIEFLVRLFVAVSAGRGYLYLTKERGWIDFLASVPLLVFSSGPVVISYLASGSTILGMGGLLNLLKVIKAIRIARVLRFLRVVKLFRNIKYVDSSMAQRHVATVTAISVTVLVGFLIVLSFVFAVVSVPGLDRSYLEHHQSLGRKLQESAASREQLSATIAGIEDIEEDLLVVRYDGETVYSRYGNEYYARTYAAGDYSYTSAAAPSTKQLEYFLDLRPYSMYLARENLAYFAIVILTVVAFLVVYSPHFALTVTDPIHVMRRGLAEPGYNLAVKIPEKYADDDVFLLAQSYNDVYLPMKDASGEGDEGSVLSMESKDIQDMLADLGDE